MGAPVGERGDPADSRRPGHDPTLVSCSQPVVRQQTADGERADRDAQGLQEIISSCRLGVPFRQQVHGPQRRQRVFERFDVVLEIQIHAQRIRLRGELTAPDDREIVAPRRCQPTVRPQAVPGDFVRAIVRPVIQHHVVRAAERPQRRAQLGSVRRHHGDRQLSRARIEAGFRNRFHTHGECAATRDGKRALLRGGELRRIEIGEGIALERRPEIEDGGIWLASEHERGAEVLIGLDALRGRHLQRPFRRHNLTQERERAFDLEPLVQLTRLL